MHFVKCCQFAIFTSTRQRFPSPFIVKRVSTCKSRLSILHARIRHQCSSMHSDLYRIYIINDPKCQCSAPYEDSIHYLIECPLYQNERYCLFRNLRETHKNIETLHFGSDEINLNVFTTYGLSSPYK
jgi:hypothetical protein